MSNIIKASDVKDNHDAIENQLQNTTESDENQIPEAIINQMLLMMRDFGMYKKLYGVESVDIRDSEIRLDLPNFLATFPEHNEEPKYYNSEYGIYDRLSRELYGVTFYAMRRCEEKEEVQ